ncbi:MAG: leucine-rich repeat domain-containing protein, partial [Clostridia bacterium]
PTEYTDEKYFYFDALHGIILDYDIAGGEYVNIPATINGVTVTTIGEHAFEVKKIYGVIIPDTVTKIGACAFRHCGIHELDLGNSVEYIGDSAFYNSRKYEEPRTASDPLGNYQSDGLTALTLPESVKYIGSGAFSYNSLTSIVIPQGVEYLSGFNNNDLSVVTISAGVTNIRDNAFANNELTSIVIPQGVEYLSGFDHNDLSHVEIPATVKNMGNNAFSYNSLASITISHGVEYLSGFDHNKLSHVEIPATVKKIGDNAFSYNSLTSITISQGVEYLSGFNNNKLSSVVIPDSVISIGYCAFADNLLRSLTIPNKVENIGAEAFKNNVLSNVTIPDSVTYIGTGAFIGLTEDKLKLGTGLNTYFIIKNDSIAGYICTPNGTLVIPYYEGVAKIAAKAFENRKDISKVCISEGIEYIGAVAFKDTNVNAQRYSVTLPDSTQWISGSAFPGSLKRIINYSEGSFTEYLVCGPNYTKRSALTNPLYNFPLDRQEIINKDISSDIEYPIGEDWIKRYICSKYMDKEITECSVYKSDSGVFNIRDETSYEGRAITSQEYRVSLKTVIDIEGLTRNESGTYKIALQGIFIADDINGRYILSGILPESEMIDSRRELYNYVKADNRFVLGEYIPDAFDMRPFPTLAENQDHITTVDLKNSQIITELTKDIVFGTVNSGNTEKYLPVGEDKVVFYLPAPVCKLYMVNYKTNEIIWSKDYPGVTGLNLYFTTRYSDAGTDVFVFYYVNGTSHLFDYYDTEGKIIAQGMANDAFEYSIPGTKWKAINDDCNVYLKDTETDSIYMVLCANISDWPLEEYHFQKALDENRFIYQTTTSGEGMLIFKLSVYDIRDGSSTSLDLYKYGYYLISNENDEYVTSASIVGGTGSQPTMFIYNDESNEAVNIKSFVDDFPYIVSYSISKDGRYAALLTGRIDVGFEIPIVNIADGILLIDLTTKEVLLQDSITLTGGSISFLSDNTLVMNDDKTHIYIDVPGIEKD